MQDQMVSKTKGARMNKNYLGHLHERCDWCLNHWLLFKNLTHELFRTFLTTVLVVHNLNESAEETNASSNPPQQLSLALLFSCFQRKSFWQTNQRYLANLWIDWTCSLTTAFPTKTTGKLGKYDNFQQGCYHNDFASTSKEASNHFRHFAAAHTISRIGST